MNSQSLPETLNSILRTHATCRANRQKGLAPRDLLSGNQGLSEKGTQNVPAEECFPDMPERSPSSSRSQLVVFFAMGEEQKFIDKQNRLQESFYNINSSFAESPAAVFVFDKLCVANVALRS